MLVDIATVGFPSMAQYWKVPLDRPKDKQKEVYTDLCKTNLGAYKGLKLAAYTVKTIAGKDAKTQVGKLKRESVQGEEISLCKIQSGGKEIKNVLDKGETIIVKSTE